MSRLDRHVNLVQTKLFFGTLLSSLAWALLAFASVVLVNVLVDRFLIVRLPRWDIWFVVGLCVAVTAAIGWTIYRRPSRRQAAVAIDEKLGLKEKFSTALFIRQTNDPFAMAAVKDAEQTADNVSLNKRFPIAWPRHGLAMLAVALAATGSLWLDQHPVFGSKEPTAIQAAKKSPMDAQDLRRLQETAIAQIDAAPHEAAQSAAIQAARAELAKQIANPTRATPEQQRQTALQTMQELDAMKQKIRDLQQSADKQNKFAAFKPLANTQLDNKELQALQNALANGDINEAKAKAEEAVKNFDKSTKEEQKKTADDMQKLADKMQEAAKQPKEQQEKLADQLKQMGASQQQVQQLADAAQKAAQGDQQAQQQMQQAAQQLAQSINNNPNLSPQQQQQIQQQVQSIANKMQGAAGNQQQAQQLANAAQQLAQAMKQQAGQPGGAQQGTGQQQAGAQQQPGGQQQQPGGQQQAGQQQAGGAQAAQQPGGQQGQNGQQAGQQGQAGGQQQGQGVKGAGQNLADQLAQMGNQPGQQPGQGQGQQPGQQGGDGAFPDGANPQQADAGQQGQGGGGQGEFQQGDPNGQQGQGGGGPGQGAGGARPKGKPAAFAMKPEKAPSQTIADGELVASQFIKADAIKGDRRAQAQKVIENNQKEAAQGIEQDKITRQKATIVKKYFDDVSAGK